MTEENDNEETKKDLVLASKNLNKTVLFKAQYIKSDCFDFEYNVESWLVAFVVKNVNFLVVTFMGNTRSCCIST